MLAEGWLVDPSPLQLGGDRVAAHRAPEHGLGHLGDEVAGAGHHPGDGDQLVDVLGPQGPHVLGLVRGVRTDLRRKYLSTSSDPPKGLNT